MIDKRLNQQFVTDRLIALADQYTIKLSRLGVRVYVTDKHWTLYVGCLVYKRTVLMPAFYDVGQVDQWFGTFIRAGLMAITDELLS